MDELSPFMLEVEGIEEAVEMEEKQVGSGTNTNIFKVKVGEVECIAKRLSRAFVSKSSKERKHLISKFRKECIILSKLRHPNIVQFVGVHCRLKEVDDLTLIMESVRSDMFTFLFENAKVPLSIKLSILLDISYGLVYLHEFNPPIVHRDLTPWNILITSKCQAKIADLGVAKFVTFQQQRDKEHTPAPGQFSYMPPEVLKEDAECTPKLDIFSFGHLTLFTVLQDHPKVYFISQTLDMQERGIVERQKRKRSLDEVGNAHCLYSIITECLYDGPEQRPTTRKLNECLISLAAQKSILLNNILPLMEGTTRAEELGALKTRIKELEMEKSQASKQMDELHSSLKDTIKAIREQQRQEILEANMEVAQLQGKLSYLTRERQAWKQEVANITDSFMCELQAQEKEYIMKIDSLQRDHKWHEFKSLEQITQAKKENLHLKEQLKQQHSPHPCRRGQSSLPSQPHHTKSDPSLSKSETHFRKPQRFSSGECYPAYIYHGRVGSDSFSEHGNVSADSPRQPGYSRGATKSSREPYQGRLGSEHSHFHQEQISTFHRDAALHHRGEKVSTSQTFPAPPSKSSHLKEQPQDLSFVCPICSKRFHHSREFNHHTDQCTLTL